MKLRSVIGPLCGLALLFAVPAHLLADEGPRPDQVAFRALYKELIETNTPPKLSLSLAARSKRRECR